MSLPHAVSCLKTLCTNNIDVKVNSGKNVEHTVPILYKFVSQSFVFNL